MKRLETEIQLSRAKMNAQEITEEENRDDFFRRSSAYNFERQSSKKRHLLELSTYAELKWANQKLWSSENGRDFLAKKATEGDCGRTKLCLGSKATPGSTYALHNSDILYLRN